MNAELKTNTLTSYIKLQSVSVKVLVHSFLYSKSPIRDARTS